MEKQTVEQYLKERLLVREVEGMVSDLEIAIIKDYFEKALSEQREEHIKFLRKTKLYLEAMGLITSEFYKDLCIKIEEMK